MSIVKRTGFALVSYLTCCLLSPIAAEARVESAYVVLGPDNKAVARVITSAAECPAIRINGRSRPTEIRSPAGTEALRPTQSKPELSKPSVFDVLTCEATIPKGARSISVEGYRLPVPKARLDRLVVIGDTGCRLKASGNAFQACKDPDRYPFARIAKLAAAWKPDAVVHVGDYNYRENPCPEGEAGCQGSPWGYGWDTWRADFFDPATPLLKAAPLILARGNHESCSRAGQGWWRFLDPRPMEYHRDCNDPANDTRGDYSDPYAVQLGNGAQIVVMDLSIAGEKALREGDPRIAEFRDTYKRLDALSQRADFSFAVDHYPILGISALQNQDQITLEAGNAAIQSAFGLENPAILPPRVNVLLAGHIHLWEQVSFTSSYPTQFIAGFSGTEEDKVPLPDQLPGGISPAPGASVEDFSSWVDGFGFMTLERKHAKVWKAEIHDLNGKIVNTCIINDRKSKCAVASVR